MNSSTLAASRLQTAPVLAEPARALVKAAGVLVLAENLSEPLKSKLSRRAERSIQAVLQTFSTARASTLANNPWPQPSYAALTLATDLTLFSAFMEQNSLRSQITKIATRLAESAYDDVIDREHR